LIYSIYLFKN